MTDLHHTPPKHALQRLERFGEEAKGILLHRMKQKAEGRVCWAAHESTAPRRGRRGCNSPSLKASEDGSSRPERRVGELLSFGERVWGGLNR